MIEDPCPLPAALTLDLDAVRPTHIFDGVFQGLAAGAGVVHGSETRIESETEMTIVSGTGIEIPTARGSRLCSIPPVPTVAAGLLPLQSLTNTVPHLPARRDPSLPLCHPLSPCQIRLLRSPSPSLQALRQCRPPPRSIIPMLLPAACPRDLERVL